MAPFIEMILPISERAVAYARRLLAGVPAENFARKARCGDRVIDTNHAAFCYGHLSLYPAHLLQILEADPAAAPTPAAWQELFNPGCVCHDDPDGSIYPPMAEITEAFFRNYEAVIAGVKTINADVFTRPVRHERFARIFPTVGTAAAMLLGGHILQHMGQVSAWRRAMGLGPAPTA